MVTTNKQPLDEQVKAFRQSSAFTPGDALSFSIKLTDAISLPGKYDPAAYIATSGVSVNGSVAVVCPGNGGLCVEALRRGAASVASFEPRSIYHKSIVKVAEFCKAATDKSYSFSIEKPTLLANAYDLIIWSDGLDEIRDPAELFRSAISALRPGGSLLIEVAHGTHGLLPKSTNAWKPSIDSFEATIKNLGELKIESRRPGRNQLRIIYVIKRDGAPVTTQVVEAAAPAEKIAAISQEESEVLFGGQSDNESALSTPKRRGRKSKPDEQTS